MSSGSYRSFKASEVCHLTYDASGTAQLWQDDTLSGQHSTGSTDTNVILFVHHPDGLWRHHQQHLH